MPTVKGLTIFGDDIRILRDALIEYKHHLGPPKLGVGSENHWKECERVQELIDEFREAVRLA